MIPLDTFAEIDLGVATVMVAIVTSVTSMVTVILTKRQGKKLDETHSQVTVNHHSSSTPTVLDRIDDVLLAVLDLGAEVNDIRRDFNGHIAHANLQDMALSDVANHLKRIESEVSTQ